MSHPIPKGGYIDPNHPSPGGPNDARIIIYGYTPSLALCILGIILFALSLILHSFLIFHHRFWSFTPFALGLTLEIIGYILRALSSAKDPYSIIYFVIQYFCIVTAPVFISASIYVCLSKLVRWAYAANILDNTRGAARLLKPKAILWIFITSDVVCTIVQVAGAALIGSYESNGKDPSTPNNILLAGLCVQTFSFTIYLFLLATFRYSIGRSEKDPFIIALAAASLLIYLRTIIRLAESAEGVFGYLDSHEVFFGTLEFMPVILAVWILALWYPGRWLLVRKTGEVGSQSGTPLKYLTNPFTTPKNERLTTANTSNGETGEKGSFEQVQDNPH